MNVTACAFTGHRPKKLPWKYDETDSRCNVLKTKLAAQIARLARAGVTDFFCGMAEGTDCYCAQIVLDLRIKNPALKLHCVLPCKGQADKWNDSAREQYHSILAQADNVEYVNEEYHDKCMLERNQRLVEQAGILLAVYNGEWRGGTAATIRYARKMGREIIAIHPVSMHITYEEVTPPPA